jgi:hypothetical protein
MRRQATGSLERPKQQFLPFDTIHANPEKIHAFLQRRHDIGRAGDPIVFLLPPKQKSAAAMPRISTFCPLTQQELIGFHSSLQRWEILKEFD